MDLVATQNHDHSKHLYSTHWAPGTVLIATHTLISSNAQNNPERSALIYFIMYIYLYHIYLLYDIFVFKGKSGKGVIFVVVAPQEVEAVGSQAQACVSASE